MMIGSDRAGGGRRVRAVLAGWLVVYGATACVDRPAPGSEAPADAAPAGPAVPAAIGEADADVPHLRVRLLEVTRVSEGAVDVRFTLTCDVGAPEPVSIADLLASARADAGGIADVFLVDEAAGKTYFVVRDTARRPVGSRDLAPIAPGASRELWTRLAAPPFGVDVVSVQFPRTRPFTGVRIADGAGDPGRSSPRTGEPARRAGRM